LAEAEKTLVLWFNSTLGLLILVANREETEGPWVQFKKPVLKKMPVLDLRNISRKRLARLASCYDDLANSALLPLPLMWKDPVRGKIDGALSESLGLPDVSIIRQLLAQEPVISLSMDFANAQPRWK
jgi:hypothetical protein